jgi:Lsr2
MREMYIRIRDDFDNEQLADKTVEFEYGGRRYEMDLTAAHCDEFDTLMARYIEAARVIEPPKRRHRKNKVVSVKAQNVDAELAALQTRSTATRAARNEIRAWCNAHGHPVRATGIIPHAAVAAYEQAHGASHG